MSENTIAEAEKSLHKNGRVVWCEFGDDISNECIPLANHAQVLHQAAITRFKYGIFVTAKVEED